MKITELNSPFNVTRGKKILFIDRDGTLIKEAPPTYQVDSFEKLEFYPGVFMWMGRIAKELDFKLVMVSNQDGLGTASFPEDDFRRIQNFVMKSLANEGIVFDEVHIDRTFPGENAPTRKPGIGMLEQYLDSGEFDIAGSFVIGDRVTDIQLATHLGCKAIWLNNEPGLGAGELQEFVSPSVNKLDVALATTNWKSVYEFLRLQQRVIQHYRHSHETRISVKLDLDGKGNTQIRTGLNFFDHMLEQLARHSGIDIELDTDGDLHIDEHHTIEDTAIALGETFALALGNKMGIERYGFTLPMDDCLAQVAIDFGGRAWLTWSASFKREKIGDVPTEMFSHFFKSFSDAAKCNLNIRAEGENEHHKIEAIFKAMAKAIKMAIKRDPDTSQLPTTKGIL